MRSDFQEKVLERALTPHFLLYCWLATGLPQGVLIYVHNRRRVCLGGGHSLRGEPEVCPKGSRVGSWLSLKDTPAHSGPPPLFQFLCGGVPPLLPAPLLFRDRARG